MQRCWHGQGVFQVHVVALDPAPVKGQLDLFAEASTHALHLNRALDLINERFGEFTIAPAKLLHRSDMPNVIAPAWKPYGHRQTIPSTRPQRRRDTSGKVHDMDW